MKNIILFVLVMITINLGMSQTGPGGVGSNDGSSSLEFWYMAQGETYSNGDLVNSVTDRSGNARTLSAIGTERPSYTSTTAAANNMSSFLFNLDDELETTYAGNSNENMSFGMIFSYNSNAGLNVALQHGGRNTIGFSSADFYTDFVGGSNHTSTTAASSTWTYHSKTFANSGTNRLRFYVNNTNTDSFTHTIQNRTSNTWIGGHGTGGGTGLDGSIAEVYKFSEVLNTTKQIIIANYLAAKYGIALTANDIYNEDDVGNGNYDHDVAGIGRIDASNLHNDSRGTGIVRILNPSGLGNDEFLFWGHDNGDLLATETADIPAGIDARFDRVWRVSERNTTNTSNVNVGALDIRWDLTGLGSVTASDLRLLIDTDNDGIFSDETPISGATSIGGNIYEFSAVPGGAAGIRNNRRFTLGTINSIQTPLPIELINFTAVPINDEYVKLEWQTASEVNNEYFTIERSINGIDWREIKIIEGAGNSSTILNYSSIDSDPPSGISYYRLKQTDYDGQFEYSSVRSVNINPITSGQIRIYPNPTKNTLNIKGSTLELKEMKIFNVFGQDVTIRTTITETHKEKMVIDLSLLTTGMYYLKTITSTYKVYKH